MEGGGSFAPPEGFRSGFVTILGRPNTGKSTLMNRILGEDLSITSPKPQTTRYAVKGILNRAGSQIVFVDTPGYLKPRYEMQTRMMKIITDALRDVDLVVFITDIADFPTDYDREVMDILGRVRTHQIAVFNKMDRKPDVDREALALQLPATVEAIHYISARSGDGVQGLIDAITAFLPFHDPYYEQDQLSDLPMRFFATEAIREGMFHIFEQEIPYATAAVIETYSEEEGKVVIEAQIWLERQSQKPIIIGRAGSNLKRIREYAEAKLSAFLQTRVELHLWVKVVPDWRKKNNTLRELGFH